MDITNLDANVWQYFFAFMEHNKIFTLILVFMAAVFLLLIKKIVKIPCNIFTGKIDSTKMMLSEWEKDILIFPETNIILPMITPKTSCSIGWQKKFCAAITFGKTGIG